MLVSLGMSGSDYWRHVQELFDELVQLDWRDQERRLSAIGAADERMRLELEQLLDNYEVADDSFLPRPLPIWPR